MAEGFVNITHILRPDGSRVPASHFMRGGKLIIPVPGINGIWDQGEFKFFVNIDGTKNQKVIAKSKARIRQPRRSGSASGRRGRG